MITKGILATLVAKEGKEEEVESFLRSAPPLIADEPGTKSWYAIKLGSRQYGIFETFDDEKNRAVHLAGKVAQSLLAQTPDLFDKAPLLEDIDVIANSAAK